MFSSHQEHSLRAVVAGNCLSSERTLIIYAEPVLLWGGAPPFLCRLFKLYLWVVRGIIPVSPIYNWPKLIQGIIKLLQKNSLFCRFYLFISFSVWILVWNPLTTRETTVDCLSGIMTTVLCVSSWWNQIIDHKTREEKQRSISLIQFKLSLKDERTWGVSDKWALEWKQIVLKVLLWNLSTIRKLIQITSSESEYYHYHHHSRHPHLTFTVCQQIIII